MFGRKCSSPGYGFVSGIFILFFIFLAALSANLHCGKTLGLEKSFEHGKVFQAYRWETRTFEQGKKKAPLIQGGGLRQAHTIEKVENPSSRLLKNTPTPEHFRKLRCRKSARRCGTKHMSKSKCTKHFSFAALFRN